jgi:hypothetical protein
MRAVVFAAVLVGIVACSANEPGLVSVCARPESFSGRYVALTGSTRIGGLSCIATAFDCRNHCGAALMLACPNADVDRTEEGIYLGEEGIYLSAAEGTEFPLLVWEPAGESLDDPEHHRTSLGCQRAWS